MSIIVFKKQTNRRSQKGFLKKKTAYTNFFPYEELVYAGLDKYLVSSKLNSLSLV